MRETALHMHRNFILAAVTPSREGFAEVSSEGFALPVAAYPEPLSARAAPSTGQGKELSQPSEQYLVLRLTADLPSSSLLRFLFRVKTSILQLYGKEASPETSQHAI